MGNGTLCRNHPQGKRYKERPQRLGQRTWQSPVHIGLAFISDNSECKNGGDSGKIAEGGVEVMDIKAKGEIVKFTRQKDYVWEKFIDEGGLGKTALIKDPTIDEYFVCKKYEPQPGIDKLEYYNNFKTEIKIMHNLYHKNIVRIFNYYLYPDKATGFILMDYINGEDIESYLLWVPEDINDIFNQVIDAFAYLEEHNILHRDIRPQNILVTNEKIIKIIDFGFGKQISDDNGFDKSISLNWRYEMPDDFNDSIYDFRTEIYFVGKLFETIIKDHNITGFGYNNLLERMITKSHDNRIDSFEKIKEKILSDGYIFDEYFDAAEKESFQDFMEQIISIYSEIGPDVNYFVDIDKLVSELGEVLKNNSMEYNIQNTSDLSRAFIKGKYKYYPKKEVNVYNLKSFIKLIKNSNKEKKNIIKLCIINRLRTIKVVDQDGFADDIPF
jgi:serine/threonine-protein kinase